jgi:Tol biopolymer transport system component
MPMAQGRRLSLPLALVCLLAACAPAGSRPNQTDPTSNSASATAIVLSVSADAVYLVDSETGVRRTLASDLVDFQAGHATWAPDHRRIAYGNGGILILDTVTEEERTLTRGPSVSMPAWSRDGKRLAYGDGRSLLVSPSATLDAEPFELPRSLAPLGMAWRPSSTIVFEGLQLDCTSALGCVSTDIGELWSIGPDGSGLRQLTRVGHAESPKWSPDGSRILFIRRLGGKEQPRSTELWEVRADGAEPKQILPLFDVVAADWSPDGAALAIVREGERSGTLQLWRAGADGSDLHPIGNPVPGTHATIDW